MHRTFISTVLILVSMAFQKYCCASEFESGKMNILLIAVDDLRPDLGCYGNEQVRSPNLDRLASRGMLFQHTYCQQAVCNPSRTSLMTGLRPDTIGVTGNHIHFRTNRPQVVTLPQHFKNHGYHAAAVGKLYHGVFPKGSSKTKWDTMGDPESWSEAAIRFGPRYYYTEKGIKSARESFLKSYKPSNPTPDDWTKKLVFGLATEAPDVADNVLYDGKVADAAIRKLAQLKDKGKPFFLGVGFIKPHSPYIAPKKYFDLYEQIETAKNQRLPDGAPRFAGHNSGELRRYSDQPAKGPISVENQKRVRHAYYACISYIDAQIGRVLAELKKQGLDKNTVVCVFGDHGYHLGEQGLWGKTTNFELDTRVPLIVHVPGMDTRGKTTKSLVELVDLYPTLAELAGLPVEDHLEGKSFVSIIKNPQAKTKDVALSQYPRGGGLMGYSMRTATHRLTQWIHRKSGEVRATELYQYSNNTIEKENMARDAAQQTLLKELNEKFDRAFATSLKKTAAPAIQGKKIKVACVGDSITFGSGIKDRTNNSYPALLQKMMGKKYAVGNFGYSGATLLKKGHKPYWKKTPYPKSLEFQPDIVIINLGANDAVDKNWQHQAEFERDYRDLIKSYENLPSKPKVFICKLLPMFSNHPRFKECMANRRPMATMIQNVAKSQSVKLIELHQPFENGRKMFPDGLHPNAEGALRLASEVFTAITGQKAPQVKLTSSQLFTNKNGTSFENCKPGPFEKLTTQVGIWSDVKGKVVIDRKHAKSGDQCLHLTGGAESVVELTINDKIKTDGKLEFWAERWTSRRPFSFRIEKLSGGKWSEIFNGDKTTRVGRAFLSHINVSTCGRYHHQASIYRQESKQHRCVT